MQSSLNELIVFYQKLASKTEDIMNYELNSYLINVLEIDDDYLNNNKDNLKYIGLWYLNNHTKIKDIEDKSDIKKQLIVFSNMIQNVYSILV